MGVGGVNIDCSGMGMGDGASWQDAAQVLGLADFYAAGAAGGDVSWSPCIDFSTFKANKWLSF